MNAVCRVVRAQLRACATLYVSLLIVACAVQPVTPPEAEIDPNKPTLPETERWTLHRDAIAALSDWTAVGKVAYEIPGDAGSASLRWVQGEISELRLSGPLGVGSTRIRNDGALLSVRRDGIERRYPADAAPWLPGNDLLPIPVESIHHWLRGIPDPARPIDRLELDNALAARIEQAGWVIEPSAYRETGTLRLPSRLHLSAPDAALKLRVILRTWDLSEVP